MRKVWLLLLGASLMMGVLGAARLARQDAHGVGLANNASYPLQIVSVSPQVSEDATEFRGAKVTLQNTGNVPCVALALSLVLTFSNSETRKVGWHEDHAPFGYAKPDSDPIAANQTYTADVTGVQVLGRESATVAGVEPRVDYVEMADGKTYGEDPDGVGETIRMTRWGHAAERKRLLSIYDTNGLQGLLGELNRE